MANREPRRLYLVITLALFLPSWPHAQEPTFHRDTMIEGSRLAVPGGTIWYRVAGGGSGTPIILLHGGPGLPSVYLKTLDALGDERTAVRYDQLGAGYSDVVKDTSLFTIAHYVQELDSLRAHLGLERVHVYGHSWGTILAFEYYRAQPEHVASLVLASPVLDIPAFFANQPRLLGAISEAALRAAQLEESGQPYDTAAFRAGMKEYATRHSQHTMPRADADTMRTLQNALISAHLNGSSMFKPNGTLKEYDATPFLKEIRVPVLYVVGETDFAGPEIAKRFARLTPGARLVVIPGSGHMMMWDNPAANLDAVRAFLHDVDSGPLRQEQVTERGRSAAPPYVPRHGCAICPAAGQHGPGQAGGTAAFGPGGGPGRVRHPRRDRAPLLLPRSKRSRCCSTATNRRGTTKRARTLEEKPAARLVSGYVNRALLAADQAGPGGGTQAFSAALAQELQRLP